MSGVFSIHFTITGLKNLVTFTRVFIYRGVCCISEFLCIQLTMQLQVSIIKFSNSLKMCKQPATVRPHLHELFYPG